MHRCFNIISAFFLVALFSACATAVYVPLEILRPAEAALSDSIHIPLPKGAGKEVDKIGEEIVEKYGEEKLKHVAKLNFLNTQRILKTLIF